MILNILHLHLLLLCVCCAAAGPLTQDLLEIRSVLQADCALECTARSTPGVQYRAIRWYKVLDPPEAEVLSGLLSRDLPDGKVLWYSGVEQEVELQGRSSNILLRNLTCNDAGVYQCHLAAPLGQQNRDGQVRLAVRGCPGYSEVEPNTDAIMVVIAGGVMIVALVTFCLSYFIVKNILSDRIKAVTKEVLLDAPLKPLDTKDLMLIHTLGPKTRPKNHVRV